jgi:hypothetical protein
VRLRSSAYVLAIATTALGCVSRYNSRPVEISKADVELADRFPYAGDNRALLAINEAYARTDAKCSRIKAAMQVEVDGIEVKNLAIGATFAGVAAALATASGLYSLSEGQQANPTVTGFLALGAGISTTPTFFYLGSDERAGTVKDRLGKIEERRLTTNDAWRAVKSAQTDVTIANAGAKAAQAAHDKKCAPAGGAPECVGSLAQIEQRKAEVQAAVAKAFQAIDALDDNVRELGEACR